ncbi:arsenic resistance N-acetyltransferase ArsN2 [Halobacterium yunchengense]|uniref:arsenic resistance N-acetyltransferase ArsN2 n=1 Tax=Halobacterium yunchengense TaxID=3108497 RepID=UPI00300B96C3
MPDDGLTVRRATGRDREALAALLADAGLPDGHVRAGGGRYYVGRVDGLVTAGGGLELCGDAALLRSVVVAAAHRGRGHGTAVCGTLEAAARDAGVREVFLLTTTATAFFDGLGYDVVDRDAAPASVRETAQFGDVCPTTATCMRREIE